jgi:hypothetical protein
MSSPVQNWPLLVALEIHTKFVHVCSHFPLFGFEKMHGFMNVRTQSRVVEV